MKNRKKKNIIIVDKGKLFMKIVLLFIKNNKDKSATSIYIIMVH